MSTPKIADEHDGFLGLADSAKAIGCGERWLRDGANHHGFPHHRFGKSMQFSAQDRAEIRKLCRRPAEPAKISKFRKASTPKTASRSAA